MVIWFSPAPRAGRHPGSSARSSSSISSTGERGCVSALQQGRSISIGASTGCARGGRGSAPSWTRARGFGEADLDHLPRHVPFVGGLRHVQALVALQAQQALVFERRASVLASSVLPTPGSPSRKRALQLQREEQRGGEPPVAEVVLRGEQFDHRVDGRRAGVQAFVSNRTLSAPGRMTRHRARGHRRVIIAAR